MSEEKQIEEMAEIMRHSCEKECRRNKYGKLDCEYCEAELLYNAGYRFQPAADVEEVVRCADCKWWHTGGCAFRQDAVPGLPAKDDFCSHGERW